MYLELNRFQEASNMTTDFTVHSTNQFLRYAQNNPKTLKMNLTLGFQKNLSIIIPRIRKRMTSQKTNIAESYNTTKIRYKYSEF